MEKISISFIMFKNPMAGIVKFLKQGSLKLQRVVYR